MSIITTPIWTRLVNDATLTNQLATYKSQPAIFTRWPAPEDSSMPYLVLPGDVSDAPFDTKIKIGRQSTHDIHCYAQATGSSLLVESIAERVRTLLHRYKLTITGYGTVLTSASGPIVNDAEGVYGRIVSYRVMAMQS